MTACSPVEMPPRIALRLWLTTAAIRVWLYESGVFRRQRLGARVISVGNLTWGGTGKTPFTIWLAQRLQNAGLRVSILTRGYRRKSRERVKVLAPGTPPEAALDDGDEVQIYLRHLNIPIGISSSRYEAGLALEQKFPVDIHLLDDGFQHLSLVRDLDFVLIDASNPWGARGAWPVLMREDLSSLKRADAVVLTRSEMLRDGNPAAAKILVQAYVFNPTLACFRVRTKLLHFVDARSGASIPVEAIRSQRSIAFCGLGNPGNFFQMLQDAGISSAQTKVFPDHHKYSAKDLRQLSALAEKANAGCLLTTEKDVFNLPRQMTVPATIYWAAFEDAVEEEHKLIDWVLARLDERGRKVPPGGPESHLPTVVQTSRTP